MAQTSWIGETSIGNNLGHLIERAVIGENTRHVVFDVAAWQKVEDHSFKSKIRGRIAGKENAKFGFGFVHLGRWAIQYGPVWEVGWYSILWTKVFRAFSPRRCLVNDRTDIFPPANACEARNHILTETIATVKGVGRIER